VTSSETGARGVVDAGASAAVVALDCAAVVTGASAAVLAVAAAGVDAAEVAEALVASSSSSPHAARTAVTASSATARTRVREAMTPPDLVDAWCRRPRPREAGAGTPDHQLVASYKRMLALSTNDIHGGSRCASAGRPASRMVSAQALVDTKFIAEGEMDDVDVIHELNAAYGVWDLDRLAAITTEDVVLHLPGRSRFAGDHRGRQAVLDLWLAQREHMAGRLFNVTLVDVIAGPHHVVAVTAGHAESPTGTVVTRGANIYRMVDGRIAEVWPLYADIYAFDAFWDS
jgi:ketosteroid isomerase-like protein